MPGTGVCPPAARPRAAAEAPAAGGKGKKGPKVSAAVRRMQEAIEAQRKAQEEAERLAEEQRRKVGRGAHLRRVLAAPPWSLPQTKALQAVRQVYS